MKRDNLFWGAALILFGFLLFLQQSGVIANVFTFFWPITLILVGGWLILSVYWRGDQSLDETFSIPLGAAKRVDYKFSHGAGQIEISGGTSASTALVGTTGMGMNHRNRLNGESLEVHVEAGPSLVPFIGPSQGIWRFQVTKEVPVTLSVEAGASSIDINLLDVQASRIELSTGASSSNVTLPARGMSFLDVESGAAAVNIRVPEATAARIHVEEGVSAINVDTNRFPRLSSSLYQSSDFDTAIDRAEINIESGLGSVNVK